MSEKDQNELHCTVLNVTNYEDFKELEKYENLDREEFEEEQEEGFIRDLTLGTYNGATDTTQWRTMDDSHILEAILTDLKESDGWGLLDGTDAGREKDEMTQAEYIRAYSEFYNVFILDGHIYAKQD